MKVLLAPLKDPSVRVFRDGHLSVNILPHPSDAVEHLNEVPERVFPDPPQQKDSVPPPHP